MQTIDKYHLLTSLALAGSVVPAMAGSKKEAPAKQGQRPNIVLVIADDCRYLDLGCYGSKDSKTPNIDRLAAEGLKFTSFSQAISMSSPTRHCLLTGIYPVRSGAYPNHTFINDGVQTLPTYLKESGYRVAQQGKKHFNPLSAFPFEYLGNSGTIEQELYEPFLADAATKKEPFFLYLASMDPHSPWTRGDQSQFDPSKLTLAPNLVDTPETRRQYCNYLAEINQLDSDVGKIDELLKKYNLSDNTVFIFTSEQGYSFPFAKWTCYDAGIRTGFIVRWKGVTKPGSTVDAMCEYVDVTPTLIDIAGGKMPEGLDGVSFLPVIRGKKKEHKEYVYSLQTTRGIIAGPEYYGSRCVKDRRFSYIVNLTPEATFSCASTTPKDKVWVSWGEAAKTDAFARQQMKAYQTRPAEELYDNLADPFQMHNLAGDPAYAGDIKRLKGRLEAWMTQQGDKGQQTEMQAKKHQWKGGEND